MTAWIVAGCVALALVLLLLVKCRAEAAYAEAGFVWRLRFGPITIAPRTGRKRRKKDTDKPKVDKAAPKHRTPDMARLRAMAELALRLLKRFFKHLDIDRLRVHFTAAFDDPYDTAMAYGYAGSAMEAVTALSGGRIRHLDLHTQLDFDSNRPEIDAAVTLSVRLGTLLNLALSALFGLLAIRRKSRKLSEKENEHGKSVDR